MDGRRVRIRRRLKSVLAHVAVVDLGGVLTYLRAAALSATMEASPVLGNTAAASQRLSANELAAFIRTGICVVQPAGLSSAWHEALSEKTRDYVQSSSDSKHH
eukprot:SAG31_NODE_20311_length_578_cov_0.728601_1_plen_102_part_01